MIEMLTLAADGLILLWLVGTWFYEGHHKRCEVEVKCPACAARSLIDCGTDHRK